MNGAQRQEFAACYEAFYWQYGYVPQHVTQLNKEFKLSFTNEDWEDCLENPSLVKYFKERAVPNPREPDPVLSRKQLDFIRTVTDPKDRRPLSRKLSSNSVSSAEYSSWMRDETFARLARQETTKRFESERVDVLASLASEANRGNVSAIKLYLELTGEYVPHSTGAVNVNISQDVRLLTQKLLEILQRHVPSETLLAIHGEIEQVLFPALPEKVQRPQRTLNAASVDTWSTENSPL